jgi:cytochrome c oxidase assembly protein subunit 15
MASIFHGLRRIAPRLSQNFFICHQCLKHGRPAIDKSTILGRSTFQRSVRSNNVAAHPDNAARKSSPLASLSQTIASPKGESILKSGSTRKFFPETSSKSVAYWLLGSAASVFGIVVFGGLTRLTESGYT